MSLTGCIGGAGELPDTGFWLPAAIEIGVAGFVIAESDGAFVVHRAVLHMMTRIKMMSVLFKGITIVNRAMPYNY